MCGPRVICGKCGNNCCNGGYGELVDGSQCDACPSAYDKQDAEFAVETRKLWRRAWHLWASAPDRMWRLWQDIKYRLSP